jgi:hypothetical protein
MTHLYVAIASWFGLRCLLGKCCKPEDIKYGEGGSVWKCPTCGYVVKGPD